MSDVTGRETAEAGTWVAVAQVRLSTLATSEGPNHRRAHRCLYGGPSILGGLCTLEVYRTQFRCLSVVVLALSEETKACRADRRGRNPGMLVWMVGVIAWVWGAQGPPQTVGGVRQGVGQAFSWGCQTADGLWEEGGQQTKEVSGGHSVTVLMALEPQCGQER